MEQPRRRSSASTIVVALVAGIIGLTTVSSRPRFSGYATVDVIQLVAAGLCFGVALVGIVRTLRKMDGV
jgi:hypothetical protein